MVGQDGGLVIRGGEASLEEVKQRGAESERGTGGAVGLVETGGGGLVDRGGDGGGEKQ